MSGDFETFFASWDKVDQSKKATNIMTLIDKLPQKERGFRFFYEMLCDFVHPNVGAHILSIDEAVQLGHRRVRYRLARITESDDSLIHVLHLISIPVSSALQLTQTQLRHFKEVQDRLGAWITKCEQTQSEMR